ncbi:PAS domain S-box protein [Candidatus Magnetomonas plexicatena]|uniref:PAS domain S-box protein n=1 Tax=Candidatus Magnetomonas plexicatena TaxID=2552947 RepID=UPI001C74A239|nr:PAS domain S-box protein [Nitrospirales bacterium LBB_01]
MKVLENQLRATAAIQESRINILFDRFSDDVKMIANRPNLKKQLASYEKNRDAESKDNLAKVLHELMSTITIFHEISLVGINGEVIYSTNNSIIGKQINYEPFLAKNHKEPVIIDTIKGHDNAPDILFSFPLLMEDNLIGFVSGILDAKYLTDITGDYTGLGKTGETVLAKRDEKGDALFIVPLRKDKNAAFALKIPKDNTTTLITQALLKRQHVYSAFIDYKGADVIGVTRYIARADWGVVVKIDTAEFMEPLVRLRNFLIISYLMLIGFILLTLWHLVRRITWPLTHLTKIATKISEGDISQRIEITSDGEIGILSMTFNQMLDRIKEMHTAAEDKFTELNVIVNTLPGIFYLTDQEGKILMHNNNFMEVTGYSSEEIHNMSVFDFFIADDKECVDKIFHKVNEDGRADYELLLSTKDNNKISYYFIFSLIRQDKKVDIVSIGVDISERVQMENELGEYREHLQELVEHKTLEILTINKQLGHEIEKSIANAKELKEKEELLRLITDSLPALIAYLDSETRYRFANKLYEDWFGYSHSEILGKRLKEILGQDYHEVVKDNLIMALSGQKVQFDGYIKLKDGTQKIIAVRYIPHLNAEDGNVKGISVIAHDITELKNTELALRESEERFRRIFEDSPIGIAVTDSNDYFIKVNNTMCQMLGYTEEEFKTLTYHELTHKEDFNEHKKLVSKLRNALIPAYKMEKRYVRKNGEVIWVNVIADLIRDENGAVVYGIGMIENITHRKEMEMSIAMYTDQLESVVQERTKELLDSLDKLRSHTNAIIQAMCAAVEARDPYTAGHQLRVSKLSSAIADELGLSEQQKEGVLLSSAIHDLGKIYVPSEILSRPGKLKASEFNLIKEHSQVGFEILKGIDFSYPVAQIVLQHHERMDGSGYPLGLKGDDILLEARIICVSDVVEAMANHRPYRPALGIEKALEEITKNSGVLYDSDVVSACVSVFKKWFSFT